MTSPAPAAQVHMVELRALIEDLDRGTDAELDAVARLAAGLLGTPVASIDTADGCWVFPPATAVLPQQVVPLPGTPVRDHDRGDDREPAVRACASAALVVGGRSVGALRVADTVDRSFSAAQQAGLVDLALLAGAVLERREQSRVAARLAADVERTRQELESTVAALADAHTELSRADAFAHGLLEVLPVGVGAVDAEGNRMLANGAARRWYGAEDGSIGPGAVFYRSDGCTPLPRADLPLIRALREGRVIDDVVLACPGQAPRLLSVSGAAIHSADGTLLGSVAAMTDVTLQRQLEERLRIAALHDPLTDLPNRALLVDRLDHALRAGRRSGAPLAVLFCDLDGFKAVNDTRGHAAGDEVLVATGRRLSELVRPGDTVGRLGGDEFVVVCPGVATAEDATAIAERIERALRLPVALAGGGEVTVGVSIGVALSRCGDDPDRVLGRADAGMYAVKEDHHLRAAPPVPVGARFPR